APDSRSSSAQSPQMRFVVVLMDDAMGLEGSSRTFVVDAAGGEAPTPAHKTEGRHGNQPGKPFWGIWAQVKFAYLRADHDIGAMSSIFDQRKQATPSVLRWMGTGPGYYLRDPLLLCKFC